MTLIQKIYVMLALLLISFGLGLGLGWKEFRKVPTLANEKPQVQVIQADGSTVLARTTDPAAKPAMLIPKGDKVLHQGFLTVALPSGEETAPTSGSAQGTGPQVPSPLPAMPMTPLKVDYSLVQQPDGTDRLIFKGPTGSVIGGEDIVVSEPDRPKELLYTAGVTRYLRDQTWGVWMERRVAFLSVGAEIRQARAEFGPGKLSTDAALRLGFSF